jgi:hypothetical protein
MANIIDELTEQRKKMLRMLEEQRQVNPNGYQGYTCAIISPTVNCGAVYNCASYNPNMANTPNDEELYYRSVGVENQKLLNEMRSLKAKYETLVYQNRVLIERIRQLESENNGFKAKKAKKFDFDVKIYESLNKLGNYGKKLYQDVINWFNT